MSKNLVIVISVLLLVMLGGIVYFTLTPKPISSPKIGTGASLQLVKSYPITAPVKSGNYYQGNLYKSGKINVVVLEGTYKEMGRQYGALLKDELNSDYNGIVEGLKGMKNLTAENIQEMGNAYYDTYPEKYQLIVQGLAETSGLGLEKAKFLLNQETYVFEKLLEIAKGENISGSTQCSGLAAWGNYTDDGKMIFGRNYDLGPVNHEYATLAVYNPIDGSIPSASFTFAGGIYATSGMNREGLFLELNNGSVSDKNSFAGSRIFTPVSLLGFLENAKNNSELETLFNSTLPDSAYIINTADKNSAYSFEWSTSKVVKRDPDKKDLMAATNIFFDSSWGKQNYDAAKDSDAIILRRDNLLKLAEKNKGLINPSKMMEIMATPIEDGGSFRKPNFTSYEIVAQPETLKMWFRIPEYQDWTEVDLAQFFNK